MALASGVMHAGMLGEDMSGRQQSKLSSTVECISMQSVEVNKLHPIGLADHTWVARGAACLWGSAAVALGS
jgi:hypothetical protein